MSSFLKKLFGGREGGEASPSVKTVALEPETYKDVTIVPRPMKEGTQWRLAGAIVKTVDGETIERTFIRADLFTSEDEARDFILRKGRQIVDENGPGLFAPGRNGSV